MIDDGVKSKTRKKTLIIDRGQEENSMVPKVLVPSGARIRLHIPNNTKLYEFLNGTKNKYNYQEPAWKKLEDMLMIAQQSKDEWAEKIFEEFIIRMNLFFPDKTEKLRKLRQLVIWQILCGEELTDAYYESLKKLR